MCKPISALESNVLSDNNESLWEGQTDRHPVSHPVLHTVYQTNAAEQWTRTQLGSIKAQFNFFKQTKVLLGVFRVDFLEKKKLFTKGVSVRANGWKHMMTVVPLQPSLFLSFYFYFSYSSITGMLSQFGHLWPRPSYCSTCNVKVQGWNIFS